MRAMTVDEFKTAVGKQALESQDVTHVQNGTGFDGQAETVKKRHAPFGGLSHQITVPQAIQRQSDFVPGIKLGPGQTHNRLGRTCPQRIGQTVQNGMSATQAKPALRSRSMSCVVE